MRSVFQNKVLTAIIILLLVANLAVLAYFSFFKDRGVKERKRPITEFVKRDVGFDAKQTKTFEESQGKHRERMKQMFEEINAAKDSFYQLVLIDNLDDSLLFDRALVVADKQRAIEMEMFRRFKTIQSMCTPEQLKKFDAGFMKTVQKLYRKERKDSSDKK